jgi:hypothetical protein
MIPADALNALIKVRDRAKPVLAQSSLQVLDAAIASVHDSAGVDKKTRNKRIASRGRWGYSIPADRPLEFIECKTRSGHSILVDLFGCFTWAFKAPGECVTQELVIRVWSVDPALSFRADWDAERLGFLAESAGRRVIVRYHFDRANSGQDGPRYHLQVGGNARPEEYCWLPEPLDVPRLPFPPLDIVLGCEMIMANFFPDAYRDIRLDPLWRGAVRLAQSECHHDYYELCSHALAAGGGFTQSLMDELWNKPWE